MADETGTYMQKELCNKPLKYMISILAVDKWKLCLHNVIKRVDGNTQNFPKMKP